MRHRALAVASLLFVPLLGSRALAQTVEDVYPLEPPDGGTVSSKPTLKIGVKGTEYFKMKFRITLTRPGADTPAYVFDQSVDKNGWALMATEGGDDQPVVYFDRKPIADGTYDWRADAWNGVEWVEGKTTSKMRIDAIPPAEVRGLRMSVERDTPRVVLEWDPVTTDRNGGAEQVTLYKIYRYEKRSMFFVARLYQIGESTTTRFVDESRNALMTPMLFYKVTAVDEVGNEPGNLLTDRPEPEASPAPQKRRRIGRTS